MRAPLSALVLLEFPAQEVLPARYLSFMIQQHRKAGPFLLSNRAFLGGSADARRAEWRERRRREEKKRGEEEQGEWERVAEDSTREGEMR